MGDAGSSSGVVPSITALAGERNPFCPGRLGVYATDRLRAKIGSRRERKEPTPDRGESAKPYAALLVDGS